MKSEESKLLDPAEVVRDAQAGLNELRSLYVERKAQGADPMSIKRMRLALISFHVLLVAFRAILMSKSAIEVVTRLHEKSLSEAEELVQKRRKSLDEFKHATKQ